MSKSNTLKDSAGSDGTKTESAAINKKNAEKSL